MITIHNGKLRIPEEERFIGFAGDSPGREKRFVCVGGASDKRRYTLYLKFDDDTVCSLQLAGQAEGDNLILIWTVAAEHILRPGIVMAQLKAVDGNGVAEHTGYDYFVAARPAEQNDEGVQVDCITRSELEQAMEELLSRARNSMPYIGTDGYWYLYDMQTGAYRRSDCIAHSSSVDAALSADSTNPVENRAVKQYVDAAVGDRVSKSTQIAGLSLDDDIEADELAEMLISRINPPLVTSSTFGHNGQYGRSVAGEPVMCAEMGTWVRLAKADDVYTKTEINEMLGDIETALQEV